MLRSDWFPVALHYRDGGFRFPGGNVERCAFNDAKGGVCNRSHTLVADRLAGSKAWYLIVNRDNPHAVVGVGWDIQAQTDRVSGLKRFTGHADSIKFVRRQRALDVSQFRWIRNLGVWGHRLNCIYKLAVLSACNRPFLHPLSGLLEAWISGQDVALLTAELQVNRPGNSLLQSILIFNNQGVAIASAIVVQEESFVAFGRGVCRTSSILVGQTNDHALVERVARFTGFRVKESGVIVVTVPDLEPLSADFVLNEIGHIVSNSESHSHVLPVAHTLNHARPVGFRVNDRLAVHHLRDTS